MRVPVLSLLLLLGAGTLHAQQLLEVPHPPVAPVLDGRLAPGEWDVAARVALPDGSTLRALHAEGSVFLALESGEERIGSICVADNQQVRVLHASMALADVTWAREGDAWVRGRDFAWGMRETGLDETVQQRRRDYHAANGWVATTAPMSRPAHVLEFSIAAGEPLRLAVAHLAMSGDGDVVRWPAAASDCATRELVMGAAPERMQFSPARWVELRLLSPAAAPQP